MDSRIRSNRCSSTLSAMVKATHNRMGTYKFSMIASDEVLVFHARVLEPDHSYAC